MSRKKDRERFFSLKRQDPTYQGFRGYKQEPREELKSVTCTRCGYVRNVSLDTKEEGYICSRCQQDSQS